LASTFDKVSKGLEQAHVNTGCWFHNIVSWIIEWLNWSKRTMFCGVICHRSV